MYVHTNTIFNQLLDFVPRNKFDLFVGQHGGDRYTKVLSTWNQFVALLYAQATGKDSLREIETGLSAHQGAWYHLGIESVARSTLSYANRRRDWQIFRELFGEILSRSREVTPNRNKFSFDNPLYALDSSTITLCLSVFDWARYTKTKGALKLHALLNIRASLPEIIVLSQGKVSDITAGKGFSLETLEKQSIIVFDRGYVDYAWWRKISDLKLFFVSRIKKSMHIDIVGENKGSDAKRDCLVLIGEYEGMGKYPEPLRMVEYYDSEKKEVYTYLTNNFDLPASSIAAIYKERWQIEIFFKWIKQNLKIKTFLGTSENAVFTQIWIAMIYYLLLAYIKFQTKYGKSLLELTRIVCETLLVRRHFIDILSLTTKTVRRLTVRDGPQMELF